ncbi:hypothetical protein SMACR_01264 [Sordaria macrospora]|uniref:WGS project CABT00000000 data, contig 2.4 n=2 Tax=Sordaria macrospora TaxID=5147 RepID=F7VQB5_SORMK|nr:uncharacterized protein SMAC_01264 [Sordaria macrospora k-hell]KAA8633749.1 hypothetical protein SMACR_01264 [Sordaria macrospora]KAH7634343.1 hypothetical protein B0T09DRAFT_3344 [Sordaria sp. MPI-SDFR-AT-0083]WPJ58856.1 hypothetical protein SMAC4_01264 [Sordaria macrospora]CCC07697.1 unnamed protein product [Sordaria macrospora k-hell]
MSRSQQPSILSFFQPKQQLQQPQHAPPPQDCMNGADTTASVLLSNTSVPPPPPPPLSSLTSAPPPQQVPARPGVSPVTVTLPANIPVLPSPPSIPSQASIVPVAEHHIAALRRINSLLLQVAYPDAFYAKVLEPLASGLFSRVILWSDDPASEPKVIGGVVCRLEPNPFLDPSNGQPQAPQIPSAQQQNQPGPAPADSPYHAIYIQSLALLSPYRSLGLAAAALDHIIASASLLPAAGSTIDVRTIYAHVWTENEEGLQWYGQRGFRTEGRDPVRGYYFKLRPDTAWIVRRDIGGGSATETQAPLLSLGAANSLPKRTLPSTGIMASSTTATTPATATGVLAAAVNLPSLATLPPPTKSPAGPPPSSSNPITRSSSTASFPPSAAGAPGVPPTSTSTSTRPPPPSTGMSYQNARPETEWNDLPPEMVQMSVPGAGTPREMTSGATSSSAVSSRSSSVAPPGGPKKKKGRAYPSAAFGQ